MQKMPPNMPTRRNVPKTPYGGESASPALRMAQRIRDEQGPGRAREYLHAMEPYLAPAERSYIAEQMGIPLPQRKREPASLRPPGPPSRAEPGTAASQSGQPPMGGGGPGNPPLQLLQLLSGMQGGANAAQGMGNMMQMAQMLQTLSPMFGPRK